MSRISSSDKPPKGCVGHERRVTRRTLFNIFDLSSGVLLFEQMVLAAGISDLPLENEVAFGAG
ncbi:hypothetical protein SISNIDRAFT_458694 [Sistotremastrum niveocremeum HHB9708]|uniref:Uncharacterized protein n=1 Tax=Sistotremastrum niveocremeum HHB9708 TaxID=1314777 RepID=A0A164QAY5_9AGAM|nr:hypothetical protein SISNIDRAFT_458694 [Sistotremastrum niveocremeum HHB9708]